MPETTSYAPGTPCWVDVTSTDVDRTVDFYARIFGWQAQRDPRPEAGGYVMFLQAGKSVAAGSPVFGEAPPSWTMYIASDDVDGTARKIADAGGTVLMEPFDVLDSGRMAVALDPTGAAFGVWQAAAHHGAQLVGEPVSLTWNELQSTDTDAAGRFYADVFGHDWSRQDGGGELTYHVANLGGRRVAGMMTLPPSAAEMGAPSHWEPVFAVDDVDETHRRAVELGAEALSEPRDYPGVGRGSVLRDPSGAVFQILRAESA